MAFLVRGQGLGLREAFITLVTLVGSFVQVQPLVPEKVGLLAEAFATLCTLVVLAMRWWFSKGHLGIGSNHGLWEGSVLLLLSFG